ncbi:hypothetical protein IJG72_04830 [bacterium]|nr:hypothetical protein [bacterium]
MGLAAGQARLLFITARRQDLEFKSSDIANRRMRLAEESSELAIQKSRELNRETIDMQYKGMDNVPLTYDRLMESGYSIRDNRGNRISPVSKSTATSETSGVGEVSGPNGPGATPANGPVQYSNLNQVPLSEIKKAGYSVTADYYNVIMDHETGIGEPEFNSYNIYSDILGPTKSPTWRGGVPNSIIKTNKYATNGTATVGAGCGSGSAYSANQIAGMSIDDIAGKAKGEHVIINIGYDNTNIGTNDPNATESHSCSIDQAKEDAQTNVSYIIDQYGDSLLSRSIAEPYRAEIKSEYEKLKSSYNDLIKGLTSDFETNDNRNDSNSATIKNKDGSIIKERGVLFVEDKKGDYFKDAEGNYALLNNKDYTGTRYTKKYTAASEALQDGDKIVAAFGKKGKRYGVDLDLTDLLQRMVTIAKNVIAGESSANEDIISLENKKLNDNRNYKIRNCGLSDRGYTRSEYQDKFEELTGHSYYDEHDNPIDWRHPIEVTSDAEYAAAFEKGIILFNGETNNYAEVLKAVNDARQAEYEGIQSESEDPDIVPVDDPSVETQETETIEEFAGDAKIIEDFRKHPDYLIQGLLMGAFVLYDPEGKRVDLGADTNFYKHRDKDNDAEIEAKYDSKIRALDNKDNQLELEQKKIDSEHSALTTEYESAKKLIDDNIKRSFNLFS